MSNTMLDISKITNEALYVLENSLNFANEVDKSYDDQFAVIGAKIGDTVNVRRPARFIGVSGPPLSVEDFNETSIPVVLTTQFHVDTQFTTKDLALNLDMFSDRVLKPKIAAIANRIDRDGLLMAKNNTANIVGTPGVAPTALGTYQTAMAYLDAEATPRDGQRAVVIEPFSNVAITDALKGLFNPQSRIGEQYDSGLMGRAIGMTWRQDQNVVAHQFGYWTTTVGTLTADTTGAFAGSLATGWASTSTITLTNSQTINFLQGDTLTIANVFAANPQNRQAYGGNKLRSFVVTASASAVGGTIAVTVSPAIITGGQFQNVVVGTTSATATVTPLSMPATLAAAVVSPQNIVYHRGAFTLAVADLELPEGVHFAGRASDAEVGLSIRVVRQYTINNDAIPTRCDVLYGWAPLYPETACRVAA